jgi:hypothetical protein
MILPPPPPPPRGGGGGSKRKPLLGSPLLSKRQCHDKASSSACKPLPRSNCTHHRGARTQDGEDPDGGLRLHPGSGQGGGSPYQPRGGQAKAATAKPSNTSPLLTTDGVDKMYHQLAEIHAITTAQLVECACSHQSDSTPSLVWVRTGRLKPIMMPSMIRLVPSPPTDFSSQALLG